MYKEMKSTLRGEKYTNIQRGREMYKEMKSTLRGRDMTKERDQNF
jgi:hypothetical protein